MFSSDSRKDGFIRLILVCACFLSGIFSLADADVLKGEHALQLMIEKNNLPNLLEVFQTVSYFDPKVDSMTADHEQHVRYRIPGEFRADIRADGFERIHVASSDEALIIVDGRIISETEGWTDHYKDIFVYRDRKQLVEKLESLGINFFVTSLGRYQGVICYVMGADYPDESVPQLWVAKDTFRPVRWIFEAAAGSDGVREQKEILYKDWQSHYLTWYPSRIEFFEGRRLVQDIRVQRVSTDPSFSRDLFDMARLKRTFTPLVHEEKKAEDRNDISHQIEEFKKIFE